MRPVVVAFLWIISGSIGSGCAELLPGTDRFDAGGPAGTDAAQGRDATTTDGPAPDAFGDDGGAEDANPDAAAPDADPPDTGLHRDGGPPRLVAGRLTTTSSPAGGPLRLIEHGFELGPRGCAPGDQPCVQGGITP